MDEHAITYDDQPAASPHQRREQRVRRMEEQFTLINKNLYNLSDVLPTDWVSEQLKSDDDLSDFATKMSSVNTSLCMYIETLKSNPNLLPDDRKGDTKEITLCLKDIRRTLRALEKLLPVDVVEDTFVGRLGKNEGKDATERSGSVAMQEPEEQPAPVQKKKKGRHESEYILPGLFETKIRQTIDALRTYAELAAPLVGVTLVNTELTTDRRNDQPVVELKEYTIQRHEVNPADFGVSEAWTRKLNFRFNLAEPSTSRELY